MEMRRSIAFKEPAAIVDVAEYADGQGKVRINKAGCMDRCDEGPVMVVYPEAVWYTYVDKEDVEEIIQEHLVHGRVVERLKI